ncbi:MAG: hypothetical protein WC222_08775 [Parachlamydiales bacterium]|jgi:hypothetical protein
MISAQFKEYYDRLRNFICPSIKGQTNLQERIVKASKIQNSLPHPTFADRCTKQTILLSLRIKVLEQQVGFFDRIFYAGRINQLISEATELQTKIKEKKLAAEQLYIEQCKSLNAEKDAFFENLSLDLFTWEPEPVPKEKEPSDNLPTEEEETESEEPSHIPEIPLEESVVPLTELSVEEQICIQLQEDVSAVDSSPKQVEEPKILPKAAEISAQHIPGVLIHPYRILHAFIHHPNVDHYCRSIQLFLTNYKYNGRCIPEDLNENFNILFEAWNNFSNSFKLDEFCQATNPKPITEYIEGVGTHYYVLQAINSFNAFIVNYPRFSLFSAEGRKQLLETDVDKVVAHIFNPNISEEKLSEAERFLINVGKGLLSLVDDLIEKCNTDAHWKKWTIALSRGPWKTQVVQTLISVFKDSYLLKGIIKNYFISSNSYEKHVQNLFKEKQKLSKNTPDHIIGKRVEKQTKKYQAITEKFDQLYSKIGRSFYNTLNYYYKQYIAYFISRFIDFHETAYLCELAIKSGDVLVDLGKVLENPANPAAQNELHNHIKELILVGLKALQNFARESDAIPYERLIWDCLHETLSLFKFDSDNTNYLQQYWEKLALPSLEMISQTIEKCPWPDLIFAERIPYDKDFLDLQSVPAHLKNKATILNHLDENPELQSSIDKACVLLQKFLGTSKTEFSKLIEGLRNSWSKYKTVVYGDLKSLPQFTNEFYWLKDLWKKRTEQILGIKSYYTMEVLYRMYKDIPFLNADYHKSLLELNPPQFVHNLFNALPETASPLEKHLNPLLKELIFWVKFRIHENRAEPGWIEYEINQTQNAYEQLLDKLGLSNIVLKAFLAIGKSNFLARNMLKKGIKYLKNNVFNTAKTRLKTHMTKDKHKQHPEIAQKKYLSKEGKDFNARLDQLIDKIIIPILNKIIESHDISQFAECISVWKGTFDSYILFLKDGNEEKFDKQIAKAILVTVQTLQKYLQEIQTNETESLLIRCLDETLQEYSPAESFDFACHQQKHVQAAFIEKLLNAAN